MTVKDRATVIGSARGRRLPAERPRPRREREDRPERNDGAEPEFAPAFLTRDDD